MSKFERKGNDLVFRNRKVPGSNAATYDEMEDSPYFAKDANQCYVATSSREGFSIIADADPASFVSGGWNQCAVDKDYVFWTDGHQVNMNPSVRSDPHATTLPNSPRSVPLSAYLIKMRPNLLGWWHPDYPHPYKAKRYKAGYDVTPNGVFFVGNRWIMDARLCQETRIDPDEPLDYVLVRNADKESFKSLDHLYAHDKTQAYFRWHAFEADAPSLETLGYGFACDKENIYYYGVRVEDAERSSFEVILVSKKAASLGADENGYTAVARDMNGTFDLNTKRLPYAEYRLQAMRPKVKKERKTSI